MVADLQRTKRASRSRTASRSSNSPGRTLRSALKPPISSSNVIKKPLPSYVKSKPSPPSPKSRPPPSPKSRPPPSPKSRPTPPPSPKAKTKSSSKPPSKSKAEGKPPPLSKRKVGIPLSSSTFADCPPARRSVKFAPDPPRTRKGVSDSTVSAASSDRLTPEYSEEGSFDEEDSPPPSKKNRTPNTETSRASRPISSTRQSSPWCATDYRATPPISPSRRRSCLKRPVKEPSPSPTSSDDPSLQYSEESSFDNEDSPPSSKKKKSPAPAYKSASHSHQPVIFVSDSSSNERESDARLRRGSPANKSYVGTRMSGPCTGISRYNIDPDLLLLDDAGFTSSSTPILPQPVSRSTPSMSCSPVPPPVNNTTRPIYAAPSNNSPAILAFASTPATAGCIHPVPGHPMCTFNFCPSVPSHQPVSIISDCRSSLIDHCPNVTAATFQSQHQTRTLAPHLNSSLAFPPVKSTGIALAAHGSNPPAPLFPGTSNPSFHRPEPILHGTCGSIYPAPSVPANPTVESNDSQTIPASTTKVAQARSHDPTLGNPNPTGNFSEISQVLQQTVVSESTGSQGLASVPHSDKITASLPSTDKLTASEGFLNSLLTSPCSDPEGNMTLNEIRRKYDLENNARRDHLFDSCVFQVKETLEHLKPNTQYQPASKNIVGNQFNQHPVTLHSSILQSASKSTPFCDANQEQFKSPNQSLCIDPSLLDTRNVTSASAAVSTAPAIITSVPAPIATVPATTNNVSPRPICTIRRSAPITQSQPQSSIDTFLVPSKTVPFERSPAVPFGSRIEQSFTFEPSGRTASAAFRNLAASAIPPAPVKATPASMTIQNASSAAVLTAPAAVPPASASFGTKSAAVTFPPAVIPTAPAPPPVPAVITVPLAAKGPTVPAAKANQSDDVKGDFFKELTLVLKQRGASGSRKPDGSL